jgi:LPXTG-site transpeptidase (sortase) family protein
MELENKNSGIFSKEGVKKLLKPFILLFLINFLIINWNDISWMFNYRVISGATSKFIEILENKKDFIIRANEISYADKENSLEIPKIGVAAPLIIIENSNNNFDKELDRGVVLFPNSVLPGEMGQTIILGHSAPSNWPKINYDGIFSNIADLEEKDEIVLYFNHQKYTYNVNQKIFLEKGEEIPNNIEASENTLLLISCWPPGKNIQRVIIESTLIKT